MTTTRNEEATAKIVSQDGSTPLIEGVHASIRHEIPDSGLPAWSGALVVPPDKQVPEPGQYRIVLDDGREGDVILERRNVSESGMQRVPFTGSGRLK